MKKLLINLTLLLVISLTLPLITNAQERMVRVSGDNQTGFVSTHLAEPLVAKLVDRSGNPIPGRTIYFIISKFSAATDGYASPASDTTDANGEVRTYFTLGSVIGGYSVIAAVDAAGLSTRTTFNATATDPAIRIAIASGNNQTGTVGQALANPFVV